ncbi:hypothetical protein PR202_gb17429 [Eleusine coracana subsp. coracana]|uniref:Uncharacterized protein n=1 Tax=Eleusine coracana subsp. coracana TaxID=191504 RepID=A0AAV5F0L8_ELECO|nr:hypothetical protein PR202_gb17429 [Eleusine coracana subsp. coracana]
MAGYTQSQMPGTVWMMPSSNAAASAGGGGGGTDSIWTFPQAAGSAAAVYRGVPSGLHFMNFPAPMALLPGGQQLGLGPTDNDSGGGGGEGHMGVLAALNAYRAQAAAAQNGAAEGSAGQHQQQHQQHGGGERQETMSASDS